MGLTHPTTSAIPNNVFRFAPFSLKQKKILTWWVDNSPYRDYDGIIADGAIRSGKTVSIVTSFLLWAMSTFDDQNFALCGKTIGSLRRNVIRDFKKIAAGRGYEVIENRSEKSALRLQRRSAESLLLFWWPGRIIAGFGTGYNAGRCAVRRSGADAGKLCQPDDRSIVCRRVKDVVQLQPGWTAALVQAWMDQQVP